MSRFKQNRRRGSVMYKSVYDYILKFADPPIEADRIFRGYPNRTALPLTNTYIVFTESNIERIGTNVTEYPDDAILEDQATFFHTFDIDLTSDNQELALHWSMIFETLNRSHIAADFFKDKPCQFIRGNDTQFIPYVDDNRQYIYRYRCPIIVSKLEKVTIRQDYFSKVDLRIENVDEHHPPIEKEIVSLTIKERPNATITEVIKWQSQQVK